MNFADSNHRLAEIEKELSELPIGYISRKVIRGKERFYHQWSENGKIKSRYLKAGEEEILRNQIERRKELQREKKRLQTPLEKHTERQVNTVTSSITGYRLLRFVEDIHTADNRECFREIKEFLSREDESRICILYGLHRTGKTTLLKQGMASLAPDQLRNTAYLSLHRGDQMSVLEQDLRNLQDAGFQFIFIDNITLLKDFISSASILSDIFASMNMKLIISGGESAGFYFAKESSLYERCMFIHTTPITFREIASMDPEATMTQFLQYGGVFSSGTGIYPEPGDLYGRNDQSSPFCSERGTRVYLEQGIINNLVSSLENYDSSAHINGLKSLYEKKTLSQLIRILIENDHTNFLMETIQQAYKAAEHDYHAKTTGNSLYSSHTSTGVKKTSYNKAGSNHMILNNRNLNPEIRNDSEFSEYSDLSSITQILKKYQEKQVKDAASIGMTKDQQKLLISYLTAMDVFSDSDEEGISSAYHYAVQPGFRYSYVRTLIQKVLQVEPFSSCSEKDKALLMQKLLFIVEEQMQKDLCLHETAKALGDSYYVFRLKFPKGAYDMVIYDKIRNICRVYLITKRFPTPEQIKLLNDPDKTVLTERRFGKICRKTILCPEEELIMENDVHIERFENFLKLLPEIPV